MPRTIRAGEVLMIHPSDRRVIEFDWDTKALDTSVEISSQSWTITAVLQNGTTALTKDNESVLAGNRTTQVRLIATTATDGDMYTLLNTVVTNESPAQTLNSQTPVFVTTTAPRS
jgi:hypothetical protein